MLKVFTFARALICL